MEQINTFEPTEFDENSIDTILENDILFEGDLFFSDALMIKGRLNGVIKAVGDLFIDTTANVEARIIAGVVIVKGAVVGDIYANNRVELHATASVKGNIYAPSVDISRGCKFNGICKMESPPEGGWA